MRKVYTMFKIIFLNLAHPEYKMWIIQEPNTLELWNKLNFEEKKAYSIYHVYNYFLILAHNCI